MLSHYEAIVWETGDDIIPRAAGQPGGTAAKLALDIELAVRDYLNEGGKLLLTGKYAGSRQARDGRTSTSPTRQPPECTVREHPCLPLLNDFQQYCLGAYTYVSDGGTDADGTPYPRAAARDGRVHRLHRHPERRRTRRTTRTTPPRS